MPVDHEIDFAFKEAVIRPGIKLFHHRSAKWKTETVKLIFAGDLKTGQADKALGAYLLRHGHGGMKGMSRVSRYMQDLYGASLGSFVTKSFGRHLMVMRGSVISAEFVPTRVDPLAELLAYASELLNDPYLDRDDFEEGIFEREQRNLLRAIAAQADNKAQYANQRLIECMFPDHPFGRPPFGRAEEVAGLSLPDVAEAVRSTADRDTLLIYAVSPRTTGALKKILKANLGLAPRGDLKSPRVAAPPIRKRARRIREHEALSQSRLAMGFRIEGYQRKRDAYAAVLGDMLLGGVSSSRLFKEIREKRSLAYSVHSGLDAATGVCAVSAGVDAGHVEQVVKLVRNQVRALGKGRFDKDELKPVYATFRKHLQGLGDTPDAMINFHLGQLLAGRKDTTPATLYERYLRVTPAKIASVMEAMRLDSVFTLAPEENGA